MTDIEEQERVQRIYSYCCLTTEWLQEIMVSVFYSESEQDRKRKALHFVGIWRASHLNQTWDRLL